VRGRFVREQLRRRGFDVVRYPPPWRYAHHVKQLLEVCEIDCLVDVGANRGQYGAQLRGFGFRGDIVSVEPVRALADEIRRRADDRWQVKRAAVGAERTTAEINVAATPAMSSLLPPTAYALETQPHRITATAVERVDVVPLDEIVDELVKPDARIFLKLDTQGYEREAIRGASRTLARTLAMQVELSLIAVYEGQPDYLELLTELRDHGFHPTWFEPFPTGPDLKLIELDCLLRRG
jgi:FkbM family methyltransferase